MRLSSTQSKIEKVVYANLRATEAVTLRDVLRDLVGFKFLRELDLPTNDVSVTIEAASSPLQGDTYVEVCFRIKQKGE